MSPVKPVTFNNPRATPSINPIICFKTNKILNISYFVISPSVDKALAKRFFLADINIYNKFDFTKYFDILLFC